MTTQQPTPLDDLTTDEAEARLDAVRAILAMRDNEGAAGRDPNTVANVDINLVCMAVYGMVTVTDGKIALIQSAAAPERK